MCVRWYFLYFFFMRSEGGWDVLGKKCWRSGTIGFYRRDMCLGCVDEIGGVMGDWGGDYLSVVLSLLTFSDLFCFLEWVRGVAIATLQRLLFSLSYSLRYDV